MSNTYAYKPSKWGAEYHALKVNEALGAGAAGPGKSLTLLMDPMQQILLEHQRCMDKSHPYYHPWGSSTGWALHLRRVFPMLNQTIIRSRQIFPVVDPGAKYDNQEHIWTFSSGYRFQFGHCKDENSWEQYQSAQFSHIAFDELTQFNKEHYDQITSRLRSSDPLLVQMLKVRSMSNPLCRLEGGIQVSVHDPHWVRKLFVDAAPQGRVLLNRKVRVPPDRDFPEGRVVQRSRIYLPAKLSDNPDKAFRLAYAEELADKPAHIRKAMLEGDWYVTPGSYYGNDWIQDMHVIRPFKIPYEWPVFRSMDWGFKNWGTVGWSALDEDDNLIDFHEYNFRGMRAGAVARRIKEIEQRMGLWHKRESDITGPADTQLWEERGGSGKTKAAEMAEVGVRWTKANKKSRKWNAGHLLERIRDRRGGIPGYMVFNTCLRLIRTLPSIPACANDPETPADGGDDHWHDRVCYAAEFASHGRKGIPSRKSWGGSRERGPQEETVVFHGANGVPNYGYGSKV